LKKKNPNASMTDLSKIAGALWREMDESEKAVFFSHIICLGRFQSEFTLYKNLNFKILVLL